MDMEEGKLKLHKNELVGDTGSTTTDAESTDELPTPVETEYTGTLVPCSECSLWFATGNSLKLHCSEVHSRKANDLAVILDKCSSENSVAGVKRGKSQGDVLLNIDGHEGGSFVERERSNVLNIESEGTKDSLKNVCTIAKCSDQQVSSGKQFTKDEVTQSPSRLNSANQPSHKKHSKICKDHKYYKCGRCPGTSFSSSKALQSHQTRFHKQELEHMCHNCGHHFKQKLELSKSVRAAYTQTGLDSWMCEVCCKGLTSFAEVEQHKLTHHKLSSKVKGLQDRYPCMYCSKAFPFACLLKKHQVAHTSAEKPHKCPHCQKSYRLKYQLDAHVNVHTKQTIYKCGECGANFYQVTNLNCHIRSKHHEWKHKCKFCGKRHITKRDMIEHERIHTGEKPYMCEECGMSFPRKQNLGHHLKAHRNERLFACDDCGKKFFRKSTLKEHIRTHTGEKPYQCQRCFKRFTQKSHLRAHLRSHLRQELEKPQPPVCYRSILPKTENAVAKPDVIVKKEDEPNASNMLSTAGNLASNDSGGARLDCIVYIESDITANAEKGLPNSQDSKESVAILGSKVETFVVQRDDQESILIDRPDDNVTETVLFQVAETGRTRRRESDNHVTLLSNIQK